MRALSELELRILDMIEPVAKGLGFDIVRVRVMGSRTPTLQIMAEKPDGTMDVEDCRKLSRAVEPVLDAEDPIAGEYALEMSSPGIDRPLTRVGDFGKWAGHEVKIELGVPVDGRKRFHGFIKSEDAAGVTLNLKDGGEATLPVSEMVKAHLVLTDKLINAARASGQAPAEIGDDASGDDEFAGFGEDFDDVEVEDDEDDIEDDFDDEDEDLASDEDDDPVRKG